MKCKPCVKGFTLFYTPPRLTCGRLHPHFLLYHTFRILSSGFRTFLPFFTLLKVQWAAGDGKGPTLHVNWHVKFLSIDMSTLRQVYSILKVKGGVNLMSINRSFTPGLTDPLHVNLQSSWRVKKMYSRRKESVKRTSTLFLFCQYFWENFF